MPKISVHLEADTAEEFASLLLVFHVKHLEDIVYQREREDEAELIRRKEVSDVLYAQPVRAPEPEPEPEVEQPAAEAKEPAQPRRGRPRKEKPAEAAEAPVEPAVAEQEATPEPVKAKPKATPHAQPENGAASRQDLLDAFSEYVQRYGASFGFSDISSLLQKNLGDGVRKASDVPEDKLSVAIGAIKTAIADNPFNRKRDYA